jgi:hypothetical protein
MLHDGCAQAVIFDEIQVHEMACDEARHGSDFRYFGKKSAAAPERRLACRNAKAARFPVRKRAALLSALRFCVRQTVF